MCATEIAIVKLRHQIMKERGLVPPKPRKVKLPLLQQEEWIPSEEFPMLPKMKYIEAKYNVKVKTDIFIGSLNDVCQRYNWEIDRSTISRWRKYLKRYLIDIRR